THAATGRSRAASNEANHRLLATTLGFIEQELRGFFFRRTADLTDHDDRLGLGISKEHLEHVDEFRALHRVTADADSRRLAEAFLRSLEHSFIGQRARTRHDADIARTEDVGRHDADLRFTSGHDAGAVRTNKARLRTRQSTLHAHHVHHRNAFRDANDERDFRIDRFADRIGCEWRRHVNDRRISAGLFTRFGNRVERAEFRADWLRVEPAQGQGSLLHPSYAGVSLGLLHGSQPDAMVLCHDPSRLHIEDHPGFPIPPLEEVMDLHLRHARRVNPASRFVGIALNTWEQNDAEARASVEAAARETGLPCTDAVRFGPGEILDRILR
ncbi:MAG: DUF1611 domain-containing protein, partial [Gammaproteobacteria bacterium]|nr:DUF1611 domain-containing protein [Gammaproteobacteria bacterium]